MSQKRTVYPLAIDPELDAKISKAAEMLGLPKAEVMRLALAIGLEKLRQANYDLAGAVIAKAEQPAHFHLSMVADAPNPSGNQSSPSTPALGAQTGQTKYPKGKRRKKEG